MGLERPAPAWTDLGCHRPDRLALPAMTANATSTLGAAFADALSRKDFDAIAELLHPEIDFRGLTPRRMWEASNPRAVIDEILTTWFEESDEIERLITTETDAFADRERVGYRFEGHNPD